MLCIPIKGVVHPKTQISLCFTHLGVYDFLLSEESSQLYKNGPGPSKPFNEGKRVFFSTVQKTWNKVCASVVKRPSQGSGGWINCSESLCFCKINIHISNVINTFSQSSFSFALLIRDRRFVLFSPHSSLITQRRRPASSTWTAS